MKKGVITGIVVVVAIIVAVLLFYGLGGEEELKNGSGEPGESTTPTMLTYKNAYYKIDYPSGWIEREHTKSGERSFWSPIEGETDNYQEYLWVRIYDGATASDAQKQGADKYIAGLQNNWEDFTLISSGETSLSGQEFWRNAWKIVYTGNPGALDFNLKLMEILIVEKDRLYILSYSTGGPEKYDQYLETVQEMIDSFEFN